MLTSFCGCSLSEAELARVAERYRRAADHYAANAHLDGDSAVIELHGDKPSLAALLDEMIAREAECCPHLHFAIEETGDGYQVTLSTREMTGSERFDLTGALSTLFPTASLG